MGTNRTNGSILSGKPGRIILLYWGFKTQTRKAEDKAINAATKAVNS